MGNEQRRGKRGDSNGQKTVATRLITIPPVERVDDLPDTAEEGSLCFVREQEESYLFVAGKWMARS